MFRRTLLATAAALSLALVQPINAQAQSIFLSAGISSISTDGVDVDAGWMAFGGFLFDIGDNGLWAGVEGGYGQNNIPDQTVDGEALTNSDIKAKPYSVMGFLGYSIPTEGSVDPYLFAGAGVIGTKLSGTGTFDGVSGSVDESESEFGFEAGAGLVFGNEANKARPYVEARYLRAGGDIDADIISGQVGVSIGLGN